MIVSHSISSTACLQLSARSLPMHALDQWNNPPLEIEMVCKKCGADLPPDIGATYQKRSICRERYNDLYRKLNMECNPLCRVCSEPLTVENHYLGQGNICRPCFIQANSDRRKRKKETEEEIFEVVETILPATADVLPSNCDHLYIMQNPRIPDEKKVGRSINVEARAKQLSQCHNFRLQILKVYHCQGYLEATIHKRLRARKVTEGDGQEWFKVCLLYTSPSPRD